jgi:hypothetical protein
MPARAPDAGPRDAEGTEQTRSIRFIDSMPKPLLIVFLLFAAAGIGLVVYLLTNPPARNEQTIESRRSAPTSTLTHDVVRYQLVDVPNPLPATRAPCPELEGIVIEGGVPAQQRLAGPEPDRRPTPLESLCSIVSPSRGAPVETREAIRALATARIRFALFTRTGDLTTTDLPARRILLAVALSRTNVPPLAIAPLLAHEGYHIAKGGPVTATQEYFARVAELGACRSLFEVKNYPRGCSDADAIVGLGPQRAVDLLVRAGFPR